MCRNGSHCKLLKEGYLGKVMCHVLHPAPVALCPLREERVKAQRIFIIEHYFVTRSYAEAIQEEFQGRYPNTSDLHRDDDLMIGWPFL